MLLWLFFTMYVIFVKGNLACIFLVCSQQNILHANGKYKFTDTAGKRFT